MSSPGSPNLRLTDLTVLRGTTLDPLASRPGDNLELVRSSENPSRGTSVKDTSPIFCTDEQAHSRYLIPYLISMLAASSAQLIQLRTLFGSARLRLIERENLAARTAIRSRMGFANPHSAPHRWRL
ncbi:hypothetical protein BJV74DRAFT_884082 [Russula compacta]|nr:hypothetical protein BJV74DRAFT_884082 [Russula compacta]